MLEETVAVMRSFIVRIKYRCGNDSKTDDVGGECSMHGDVRYAYVQIFSRKT